MIDCVTFSTPRCAMSDRTHPPVDTDNRSSASKGAPLLDIRRLKVEITTRSDTLQVLNGVDLRIDLGESVGLVGESGSGKSLTCLSVVGMLPETSTVIEGEIHFAGKDLLKARKRDLRRIRGRQIGMILQDPMSSLNPTMTVGRQVTEPVEEHLDLSGKDARARAIALLSSVQIPDVGARFRAYPHEMSGGMRQRVVGAIGISCDPVLLIADEPTTALDVTIQAQYLSLLRRIQADTGCALLLVTHDLAVISATCDRVAVMYAGRIVEEGPTSEVLSRPRHPYTKGLISSLPTLDGPLGEKLSSIPGQPPDPGRLGPGCSFFPRCMYSTEDCLLATPPFVWESPGHGSACIHSANLDVLEHRLRTGTTEKGAQR